MESRRGGGKRGFAAVMSVLRGLARAFLASLAALLLAAHCPEGKCSPQAWSVTQRGTVLEIAYGCGDDVPHYAALHLESGYFRMNYGPGSGWGTSVVLVPSFWEGGTLYQGAPIEAEWETRSGDLVISIRGRISHLSAQLEVRLSPPGGDSVSATVVVTTSSDVVLDDRPGEAFKLVMLSSMRVAADTWDVQSAYVGSQTFKIPASGWIIQPPVSATRFGLVGGTSSWKTNAPTIGIVLDEPREITGWVTASSDPNDDNVGFWVAAEEVVGGWGYVIVAKR